MLPILTALIVLAPSSGLAPVEVQSFSPTPVQRSAQDELPDKREEVAELLATLKDHAGKRGAEDREAALVMSTLVGEFKQSGPKDRKAIVAAISKTFKQKRKEDKDGNRDNKLFIAGAEALASMAPESVKAIEGWIGHKSHKKDLKVQRALIVALGKTKDEKSVKLLIDLLKDKDASIQAGASDALFEHGERDQKVRKEIFKEIMKVLIVVHNKVETDVTDVIARERLDVIKGSMITTLQVMSGQDITDPNKFRDWWNKNKKKNWDED